MFLRSILLYTTLLIVMFLLLGCFASNPKNIRAFMMPQDVNVTAELYILQPPDEVQTFCAAVPEINQFRQRIRPDGKISFEKLGDIEAAGRTPEQLADTIEEKFTEFYSFSEDNPINVQIATYRSAVFYVLGQVNAPGPKIYTGRDSVLTAVTDAGPTPLAWIHRIQVIRPSSDKKIKPKIFELDLDKMRAYGDTSKNVLLNEGDIIYVPPTVLAWLGMKIEEIIRPIARAFTGYYIVNRAGSSNYGGGY
ncbi:MAG: polysaccharide biosynthesis/export family protein [Sedimentisphaerales bacterium]